MRVGGEDGGYQRVQREVMSGSITWFFHFLNNFFSSILTSLDWQREV